MPPSTSPDRYYRASSIVAMAIRGRSILSFRHNQVASMDHIHEEDLHDFDLFQSRVANGLSSLAANQAEPTPSLLLLTKLLDAFLSTENEFSVLLNKNPALVLSASSSSVDRLLSNLIDCSVKSLDICNELTQYLQCVRRWNLHASIAAAALGNGQLNRAKKALSRLLASQETCGDERREERSKDGSGSSRSRPLSRSCWSVGKHLQGMSLSLLPPPRGGVETALYTNTAAMTLTMFALAAAFLPVSSGANLVVASRQLEWGPAVIGMQERIGEESRRRGGKGGVLFEVLEVERMGRDLVGVFELGDGGRLEVVGRAEELGEASRRLDEGLGRLERKIREVFHRIVRSREEVMKCLDLDEN